MAQEMVAGMLSPQQIVRLAAVISRRDMESIAEGYMDISHETLLSLKDQHRDDTEAFNRDVIRRWAYKPENCGSQQIQVKRSTAVYRLSLLTKLEFFSNNVF